MGRGVSLNGGTPKPPQTTPKWSLLLGKTNGCWGNPAFSETPYYKNDQKLLVPFKKKN